MNNLENTKKMSCQKSCSISLDHYTLKWALLTLWPFSIQYAYIPYTNRHINWDFIVITS